MTQAAAKFAVGDRVKISPAAARRYGGPVGTVSRVERLYRAQDYTKGVTAEGTIASIVLPHTFDGETLTVNYPAETIGDWSRGPHTIVSKFAGYSVSVRLDGGYHVVFNERSLRKAVA